MKVDMQDLDTKIDDIIVKTIISAETLLNNGLEMFSKKVTPQS